MKKILIIIITLLIITACTSNTPNTNSTEKTREESTLGYSYRKDTICDGHVYIFDNHGMMEHPECPKCEQKLKRIIQETVDSILDVRAVENMAKGF